MKEEKDLRSESSDTTLLQQETVMSESHAALQLTSNINENEVLRQRRNAENNERYYEMQCKLSYLVWKSQIAWPVFDKIAEYFHVGVAVAVLAFALYY